MVSRIISILLLLALGSFAQDEPAPRPIPLHASSTNRLPVPGFPMWGLSQCDLEGNLYFRIGQELNDTAILRMKSDGTDHDLYNLPSEYQNKTYYVDFRANPEGDLHVLVEHQEGGFSVFSYKRDSTSSPSRLSLDVPKYITATDFAVLKSGAVLFSGTFNKDAPGELRGKPYHAEFTPAGKLRMRLDGRFTDPHESRGNRALDAIPSMDERGTLYVANGNRILVFSEAGGFERELVIPKPGPEFRIARLQVSSGRIAVWFMQIETRKKAALRIGLFDSLTGQLLAMYEPDDELGNNAVCFTGTALTFFRVKNEFVELRSASVR